MLGQLLSAGNGGWLVSGLKAVIERSFLREVLVTGQICSASEVEVLISQPSWVCSGYQRDKLTGKIKGKAEGDLVTALFYWSFPGHLTTSASTNRVKKGAKPITPPLVNPTGEKELHKVFYIISLKVLLNLLLLQNPGLPFHVYIWWVKRGRWRHLSLLPAVLFSALYFQCWLEVFMVIFC